MEQTGKHGLPLLAYNAMQPLSDMNKTFFFTYNSNPSVGVINCSSWLISPLASLVHSASLRLDIEDDGVDIVMSTASCLRGERMCGGTDFWRNFTFAMKVCADADARLMEEVAVSVVDRIDLLNFSNEETHLWRCCE